MNNEKTTFHYIYEYVYNYGYLVVGFFLLGLAAAGFLGMFLSFDRPEDTNVRHEFLPNAIGALIFSAAFYTVHIRHQGVAKIHLHNFESQKDLPVKLHVNNRENWVTVVHTIFGLLIGLVALIMWGILTGTPTNSFD